MHWLLLLTLFPLAGCSVLGLDRGDGQAGDFEDVYRYTAYDEGDRAVVTGTLYVVYVPDRKSTRLNSSHVKISYAVFCLKKKKALLILTPHFEVIFLSL